MEVPVPSITKQRSRGNTYLYESWSFWDPVKKRPDNHKKLIGKIDRLSDEPVYKQAYLDKLALAGHSTTGMRLWDKSKEARVMIDSGHANKEIVFAVMDSVRDFGTAHFLRELAEKIGLLGILRQSMPYAWEKVFCLACYLIATDRPVLHYEYWLSCNAGFDVKSMESRHVSELFSSFGETHRDSFYQLWYRSIREREYIALDMTSVASYLEPTDVFEWGSRDENLSLVNICMLFGEHSRLPVYQTRYSGSLRDVSTLKATISEFSELTGTHDIMITTDRGFFSTKNVNMLLSEAKGKPPYRFLMEIPCTNQFAKSRVESERKDIDSFRNVIHTSDQPIHGICRLHAWNSSTKLNAHVFFDTKEAKEAKSGLYHYVMNLAQNASRDPFNRKLVPEYKKYLTVRKSRETASGVTVNIREDLIAKGLETTGWFVLLSNHIDNAQTAYDICKMKDVTENYFLRYSRNLGVDRLRIRGDERTENKLFVAFIALIIASAVRETMRKKNLFERMTIDRLVFALSELKVAVVNGQTFLSPATKEQMDIFEAFEIPLPDYGAKPPAVPKKRGRKPGKTSSGN